ncbi:hypothetical protein Agub_g215 [Astrephomene gubernaculifera]|uniref:Receptor ligand binding region domain-containing protein n=1 Tax=Astrephomene gubernaculifera TaxID=47775 RepID=A0AAD3DDN4_9CHLO|nr:hypothetical protein Agub_g215 [Astrephomene gubernaculifera]
MATFQGRGCGAVLHGDGLLDRNRRFFMFSALIVIWGYARSETIGTFTVGIATSISGPFSEWNEAINGYKLWESAVNAAGGISIRDINGTSYQYGVRLVVRDDNSTEAGHASALDALLNEHGAHFILGASPAFAEAESIATHAAGRLNFHCCSGDSTIYARDLKNVFGMSIDNSPYTQELFTEFRSKDIFKVAVIYRNDVQELQTACQGVIAQAKAQLLTVVLEVPYDHSSNTALASNVDKLAASTAEALVMCGLAEESSATVQLIDKRQKPLKAIVFTGGAYKRSWNNQLGNLSVSVFSFASWAPDLSRKDNFWGDSSSYALKYGSVYNGSDATYIAAAASATGYTLQVVLADLFRKCSLSAAALADPAVLLFTQGAINCSDYVNRGHDRLLSALAQVDLETFYGTVSFNRYRQNQGYSPVTLQTYEVTENLMLAYKPSVVLPLSSATRPLLLPQHNRYAPVCQPGTYRGTDEFVECIPCNPGEFQEFSSQGNCELCAKDFYADQSSMANCRECPANTLTTQRGSKNLTDCICKVGFYNRDGLPGLPCEACPKNAVCEGGTSMPFPLPGFYAEPGSPHVMYPCNPSSVCAGNYTCAAGYRGRMCSKCAAGYFRFLGNCVTCPHQRSTVLGYLVVLALLWIVINVSFARSVENLMVVVNFCQLLSIIVGFSLNWPQKMYQVMSLSSILSFEMDSLEPSCLVPDWGFEHNLLVQLLLPLTMATIVALYSLVTFGAYWLHEARMTRSARAASSLRFAQEPPWRQVLWTLLDVPGDKRELYDMFLERCAVPLNFLNIGFLVMLKYNLSAFKCTSIAGVKYIAASPNDLCYTKKHWNLMLLGTTGLIVYNFGFIFLYGHVMRQLRKHRALGDRKPLLLYGWMYERYEAQYYWYETTIILQRMGFVLVSLFVSDPALQAVLCMIVSVAVLLLDMRTSAYMDKQIHLLQAVAEGVVGALLVAGLLFYNPLSDPAVIRPVEYVLLVAVIAAFCMAVVSVVEGVLVRLITIWLMSKHRLIAHKMGQRVKGYRHMYQVFGTIFLFNWLRKCTPEEWDDWHRMCMILIDYVHPTSDVSYLSLKKVGRFWRYLLSNFPETIDYLVSVDEEQRAHFNSFAEVLYDSFFDTKEEHHYQVYYYINDKFKAAFAQWLSSCEDEDRAFCQQVMKTALGKAIGTQAATELGAAMCRSSKLSHTLTALQAIEKFRSGLSNAGNPPPPPESSPSPMPSVRDIGGINVRFRASASDQPEGGSDQDPGSRQHSRTADGSRCLSILKSVRYSTSSLDAMEGGRTSPGPPPSLGVATPGKQSTHDFKVSFTGAPIDAPVEVQDKLQQQQQQRMLMTTTSGCGVLTVAAAAGEEATAPGAAAAAASTTATVGMAATVTSAHSSSVELPGMRASLVSPTRPHTAENLPRQQGQQLLQAPEEHQQGQNDPQQQPQQPQQQLSPSGSLTPPTPRPMLLLPRQLDVNRCSVSSNTVYEEVLPMTTRPEEGAAATVAALAGLSSDTTACSATEVASASPSGCFRMSPCNPNGRTATSQPGAAAATTPARDTVLASLRRSATSRLYRQAPDLPPGDLVLAVGNPDIEELDIGKETTVTRKDGFGGVRGGGLGSSWRGNDGGVGRANNYNSNGGNNPPLKIRGDSAENLRGLDEAEQLGSTWTSVEALMTLPVLGSSGVMTLAGAPLTNTGSSRSAAGGYPTASVMGGSFVRRNTAAAYGVVEEQRQLQLPVQQQSQQLRTWALQTGAMAAAGGGGWEAAAAAAAGGGGLQQGASSAADDEGGDGVVEVFHAEKGGQDE